MDLIRLASAAVAIRVWRGDDSRAIGSPRDDALTAICELVDEMVQEDLPVKDALGTIESDRQAQANLQRYLLWQLRREVAYRAELLRLLLEAGEVTTWDGTTTVFIADPPVTIELPWISPELSGITAPADGYGGRSDELDTLIREFENRAGKVAVLLVAGDPGMGRTDFARALAQRACHGTTSGLQLEIRFSAPVSAGPIRETDKTSDDALLEALLALGVPARAIPIDHQRRVEIYRREVAGRRPFIVLDDVCTYRQVEPLIPPDDGVVVITGTGPLPDTPTGRLARLDLRPFTMAESMSLLRSRARVDTVDDEAARAIATACLGVPFALALIARRISPATDERVEYLRLKLNDTATPGDNTTRPINAALRITCSMLDSHQRRVLHVAALLSAPLYDARLLSVATGLPVAIVEDVLSQLVDLSLLQVFGREGDRWCLHPLVARYAAETAPDWMNKERDSIVSRAAELYLRRLRSLADLLRSRAVPQDPVIERWARAQAEAEWPAFTAALRAAAALGLTRIIRRLGDGLISLARVTSNRPGSEGALDQTLKAARQADDRDLEARTLRLLSDHAKHRHEHRRAEDLRALAIELDSAKDDPAIEQPLHSSTDRRDNDSPDTANETYRGESSADSQRQRTDDGSRPDEPTGGGRTDNESWGGSGNTEGGGAGRDGRGRDRRGGDRSGEAPGGWARKEDSGKAGSARPGRSGRSGSSGGSRGAGAGARTSRPREAAVKAAGGLAAPQAVTLFGHPRHTP